MELTTDQVTEIARVQAQMVVNKLHRYAKTFEPPRNTAEGLEDSMTEELTAGFWYRERARVAQRSGDSQTASLYEQIATEEDEHYREFNTRLNQLSR